MRYLDTGSRDPAQSLGKWIRKQVDEDVAELRLQTGYFSIDAVGLLLPTLQRSSKENRIARILIGSNEGRTLRDHVAALIEFIGMPRSNAKLGIVSFAGGLFHPKVYHFRRPDGSEAAYVGSANLTGNGLVVHVEAGIILDTRHGDLPNDVSQIACAIDAWFETKRDGLVAVETIAGLNELVAQRVLALAPPPKPGPIAGAVASLKSSRPSLKAMATLPPVKLKGGTLPAAALGATEVEEETAPILMQVQAAATKAPSVPKKGFPEFILFDPAADDPTHGFEGLTGSQLPGGAVGLILRLNKDTARLFQAGVGTANISIPFPTVFTLRFGLFGQYKRPRAEFELRLRYVGDGAGLAGESVQTNVMVYGFEPDKTGHPNVRMVLPGGVLDLANEITSLGLPVPNAGDLIFLEWPTGTTPSFGLTFLQSGSALASRAGELFTASREAKESIGRGACWLPAGLAPSW